MTRSSTFYLSIFILYFLISTTTFIIFLQIDTKKENSIELLNMSIEQEAQAHFNNMVDTRKWNASHGGVFIKEHDGIKPNPYLLNNILTTDSNETLIKINPAWMTRQISEIANSDNDYYYKITSLNPINPNNVADDFEKEALEYFEKNRESKYYYKMSQEEKTLSKFDFMGSLKVTPKCMSCHEYQGYKVGDIRGGLRVSIPTKIYNKSRAIIEKEVWWDKLFVVIASLMITLLITLYLRKSFIHTIEIEDFNSELEEKVKLRTQEIQEINKTLELRVEKAVQKNKDQNESMLAQSRNIAMGEMLRMLAHQWRQPLTSISMQANNILVDLELGDRDAESMKENMEYISQETQNLSNLISTFSDFFETSSTKKLVKLEEVMDDALSILSASLEDNAISVEKHYESESQVEILTQELFQVYWNILNNAKDILIQREILNPQIKIKIFEDESEFVTTISDNGGGVKDEDLSSVFEPYYSTHSDLNGKGLGLYISRSIMQKQLHGSIELKNGIDGATFVIKIPK